MIKTALFVASPGMPDVRYVHLFSDEIEKNIARAAQFGFDGIEFVIGDPDDFEADRLEKALIKNNIELACLNTGRMYSQYGLTLVHEDEDIRRRAFQKLQILVKIASRFKCYLNVGLFRGKALEDKPIAYTRDMFIEIMKHACDIAKSYDVIINFEPTNRFEINFINTTDEGLEIIKRIDRSNCGLVLDLYHIYLEDRDIEESIRKAKEYVKVFHFSDSDRWPAGTGNGVVDFGALMKLLKEINYSGFLTEGLVPTDNIDECAVKTAAFLKRLISES